jgi:hypothetical protein
MSKSALKSPFSEEPILLHELYHRIGNEFASIIGIVLLLDVPQMRKSSSL